VRSETAILHERQTRDVISIFLKNASYRVFQTDTEKETTTLIERCRGSETRFCDLILDTEMSGLTGIQVLESIRSQRDETPAVVVTGLTGTGLLSSIPGPCGNTCQALRSTIAHRCCVESFGEGSVKPVSMNGGTSGVYRSSST
jgi:CheY-like chemotaxis protein